MSEDPIGIDHMDYAGLTQNALRGVIRQAMLKAAAPQGLPGEHHFYITFLTHAEGVSLPADVMARYPRDITIVLQHQYRDLKVFDDHFNVTLSFGGTPKVLRIPFSAITRFNDPAVQFMLEFEIEDEDEPEFETHDVAGEDTGTTASIETFTPARSRPDTTADSPLEPAADATDAPRADDTPKVVSLEHFRKK
jgi:uncharacterized protein